MYHYAITYRAWTGTMCELYEDYQTALEDFPILDKQFDQCRLFEIEELYMGGEEWESD
jgi:hypothetical protein